MQSQMIVEELQVSFGVSRWCFLWFSSVSRVAYNDHNLLLSVAASGARDERKRNKYL